MLSIHPTLEGLLLTYLLETEYNFLFCDNFICTDNGNNLWCLEENTFYRFRNGVFSKKCILDIMTDDIFLISFS